MFNNTITYQYQPIVSLERLEIERYEALLRGKNISNVISFIRHVQSQEKGVDLDLHTLKHVLAEWHLLPSPLRKPVAVNISPNSIDSSYFREYSLSLMEKHRHLELSLEITEDAPLSSTVPVHEYLHSVQAMGITVGLDDLGDGHSSLDQVGAFNLDYIKLSHTLTTQILSSSEVRKAIVSIIEYVETNGLSLVAEHIDSVEQFRWLRDAGVSHGQGWLFAKAGEVIRDVPAFEERLRQILMH